MRIAASLVDLGGSRLRGGDQFPAPAPFRAACGLSVRAAEGAGSFKMRLLLLLLVAASAVTCSCQDASRTGLLVNHPDKTPLVLKSTLLQRAASYFAYFVLSLS